MSGTVIAATAAALTTAATVLVATLPEAQMILSPVTEGGSEYAIASVSVLASLPMLAVLSLLAISGRD